jgi:membrane protein required for beta-lactamase induction
MSGESRGVARLVECTVCGRTMGATGMGRHMRAHADADAAREGQAHLERLAGHKVTATAVAPATDAHSGTGDITAMDVALAVLTKLSPDGRVAVDALPEVLDWVAHTDRVVRLVRG